MRREVGVLPGRAREREQAEPRDDRRDTRAPGRLTQEAATPGIGGEYPERRNTAVDAPIERCAGDSTTALMRFATTAEPKIASHPTPRPR